MKKTTRMHAVIKVNRTLMVCLFYLFFILLSEPQAQAQTQIPFSSLGYAYEKTITIDHNNVSGGNDLADFPLLVSLVDADIATISNGGHVYSTDGLDIVFTDTAGYILDYEIERYSQTNGTLIAWIRLPVLHWDEDAKIKMLYGNPQFSDNSGSEDVWNSNYKGVWHLHNDLLDATITNNDGKSGNTVPVNGKIADGYDFDEINDTITIGTNGLLTTSGTISIWANTNAISAGPKYIFGHTLQSAWSSRLQLYVESNRGLYLGMGGNHSLASNIQILDVGAWYYITLVWNGGNYEVFVNGTSQASGVYGELNTINPFADIGNDGRRSQRNEGWDGIIDEVRISDINRTTGWIATEYGNQNVPGSFYDISEEKPHSLYDFEDICQNDIVTYSVPDYEFDYTWDIEGGDIISGDGTEIIEVQWTSATDTETISLDVYDGINTGFSPEYDVYITEAPVISADPSTDTICNGTLTNITLSSSIPGSSFAWRAVSGSALGAADGTGPTIAQILHNTAAVYDSAVYRAAATRPAPDFCVSDSIDVVIWVDPTVTLTATDDTICDGGVTAIPVTSANTTTNGIRYTWTVTGNGNIEGEENSTGDGQDIGTAIAQTLDNTSDDAQVVTYTITPWTVDENDDNACAGTSIDIDVWVDPTAKVSLDPEKDTICTSLNSSITISSVTESLHPLRFYYEALYPVPDVEVFYRQDTSNLIKGSVIADSIVNHSSVPQKVAFVVSPYLMDAYGERKCYGISDTSHIWVAPTLRVEVDTISTYIGGNNIRCFGQNNGSIYLRPTGGITAFDEYNIFDLTYEWSNGRTTKDISGLPAGSYSVIINDKFNCIDDSTFVLTQPQKLISEIIVIDTLSCHGADGTIAPLTTGGMQGYNYTWTPPIDYHLDPPVHTDTLFNVIEGYYILQVIDTNNCAYTTAFDVSQPLPVYVGYVTELYGDYEIRCHGENSGRMITFNNSLSMLTYEWTGPNGFDTTFTTNERFIYYEDLYAGQYSLFYTDAAGCSGSKTVNLYEPDSLVINDYTISEYHDRYNVSCYGSGDGSISLNEITGGHDYAGYSYAWTVESGSGTVDPVSRNQVNLSAGTYAVKVNDSFNCSATDTFELKEPDRIEINTDLSESVNGMYNLNCEGDHDGYIILHVSGGDTIGSNYTYQWRHGPSATELHDLTAGSYTIEVTDGIGCSRTDTIELTEPSALLIDSVALSDYHGYEISCFGLSNGTMLAYPNGGAEEYSYDWYREDTPLSRDTIFIDSLRAGNYSLILTDANNCSTNWSGTLNEPVELSLSVETENANCTYTRLGTAQATVDGGVGPYGYSWDSGQSTAYIANLDTGTYVLTVQDMNACQVIDTVNIEQNVNITLNLQIVQEISCYKGSDGIVMAVASSGVEPYTYLWDDGSTTETISGLSSGTYSVLVTDQDGCSNVDTIPVMDPEKIRADFSATDALCFGSADGTVILDATGGAGNYSYYWNGSLLPDAMVTGLSAGTYVLDISDSKECNVDTVVVIDQPQPIVIHRNDSYTFVPFCPDWANGTLAVHVTGGTPEYEYIWTDFPEEHDSILTDIREDWYSVRVIDEHGCIADATFHIEAINNTCLGIPTAFTPNYDHANDTWDLSYINEDGGDAPFHEVYPNGVIQVYDRWGTLVFRCTGGCPNPWNGEDLKGRELPVDSYYYIIELNEGKDLPPLKGTVTIIR